MRKPLSKTSLAKEASYWERLKAAVKGSPGKTCLK